jgi:hypothetical protein
VHLRKIHESHRAGYLKTFFTDKLSVKEVNGGLFNRLTLAPLLQLPFHLQHVRRQQNSILHRRLMESRETALSPRRMTGDLQLQGGNVDGSLGIPLPHLLVTVAR